MNAIPADDFRSPDGSSGSSGSPDGSQAVLR